MVFRHCNKLEKSIFVQTKPVSFARLKCVITQAMKRYMHIWGLVREKESNDTKLRIQVYPYLSHFANRENYFTRLHPLSRD